MHAALLIDGLIIVTYFVAIVTIGMRLGRRDGSLHEFALGGRNVPWWAVMASIIAAETSAATFLGSPGEGFSNLSLAYVQLVIGVILGRLVVAWLFIGPYYRYKVYTVYDYLGIRFGPASKSFVSGLFLAFRTLASGARLFIPALVIVLAWKLFTQPAAQAGVKYEVVTNITPYFCAILVLMIATCLYTAVGGIKAVIWTDVIQASVMFGSALLAIGTLMYHLSGDSFRFGEGVHTLLKYAPKLGHREGYFVTGFEGATGGVWSYAKLLLANQYTIPAAIIGASFGNMAAFGSDQDMVQRLLTSETASKARRSMMTAAFMDFPIAIAFTLIGVMLFAYYSMHPEFLPMNGGKPTTGNVFGSYILNVMPAGVRGLVLAGVFATAMGSLSAALNALATAATNDWYLKYRRNASPREQITAARVSTVIFAVAMVVVATLFAVATIKDPSIRLIPLVLGIGNYILGPMLGVFLLGMLTKRRGSDTGNVIAVLCGLLATFILGGLHIDMANLAARMIGSSRVFASPLPTIAFTWFALIGASVVFVVGVCFATPAYAIAYADSIERSADAGDERPIDQRGIGQGGPTTPGRAFAVDEGRGFGVPRGATVARGISPRGDP